MIFFLSLTTQINQRKCQKKESPDQTNGTGQSNDNFLDTMALGVFSVAFRIALFESVSKVN